MLKKATVIALTGLTFFLGAKNVMAYEVQPNDTLTEIAVKHGLTLKEIVELNPQIKNINLIYPKQVINTKGSGVVNQIPTKTVQPEKVGKAATNFSNYEIDLLARLVRAEAESEPYLGKVAVAEVVLNRVNNSQFPNTITDVIYARNQFTPVVNGSINRKADSESVQAVYEALKGTNYTNGALFFYDPVYATSRWLDSRPTATVIGGHTFKY